MSIDLIKNFDINGLRADVGSDWHFPLDHPDLIGKAIDNVKRNKKADVMFCMGDLFDTQTGEDSSDAINALLEGLSSQYDRVIFTPGNHDLRGRGKPWESFDVRENVIFPRDSSPIVRTIGGVRVLVANLFYDMEFVNPALVGFTSEMVRKQYKESNDGLHLLNGETELFKKMRTETALLLKPNIDVLATHVLAHPSLVTFRVAEISPEIERLKRVTGLQFICDPIKDEEEAQKWRSTAQGYRDWWNAKSIYMGTNVLEDIQANPRDGLTVVHGHHHRNDLNPRIINGKQVNFVTHQPNPWNEQFNI